MGHGLIHRLADMPEWDVLALDVREIEEPIRKRCAGALSGDILDARLIGRLVGEYEIHAVFHLAALLSTRAEFVPDTAHEVNVSGTLNLLKLAVDQARWHGRRVTFMFPSSIAVYGFADVAAKAAAGRVKESEATEPHTMYGCNKLYCEHLGRYFAMHYRQLASTAEEKKGVDFRSIRFPGLISAFTLPSGGTSDYAPEMVHSAAQKKPYECFVREDTRIPFMAMPDAIDALLGLMGAPGDSLTRTVYNIAAYSPSAMELAELTRRFFPDGHISFNPDQRRQGIVDSWPEDVNDDAARRDWSFAPKFDLERTFAEYLVPNVRARYRA